MAQKLKAGKRIAILKAARSRFRKQGIKQTSMNEIAEDAGLAVGNLYRYFANKTEIIAACAEEFADAHKQTIEEILASKTKAFSKLETYILARFEASQRVRTGSDYVAEIARAVIEAKPDRLQEESQLFRQLVLNVLKTGTASGEFVIADVQLETDIFCYALAFFFPVAGNVVVVEPELRELKQLLKWFKDKWTI
ncbi:MAG TPA: TetR/AcrR family transcriptional regulator [Drouetiella sp.]|jgi:AcrR family transcriptional regulator